METQQTDQQTGQQATNAALAALAAAGNAFALGQLWEINQGFVRQQLRRWYDQNRPVADAAGLGFDDLVQEGYFAVDYAAKHYNAEQGSFTTYLSYALLKQIRATTCGEHTRSIPTEDGRRVLVSANPLNSCSSLDLPLDGEDEGSSTRGETIPDPAAAQEFHRAEDSIYTDELHTALEEALSKLATRQADVLRRRYYDEKSLRSVGEEIGLTSERVRQVENTAFRKLRKDPALNRWREDIISRRAYQGTGFSAWANIGSVEERILEELERLGLA